MLQPKKVKHRKVQKGRMRGKAYRGSALAFGDYGLQATEGSRVTARQIEAARIATEAGHPAVIADGRVRSVITGILKGEPIGTFFAPLKDRLTHKKHWIAHTLRKKGELVLEVISDFGQEQLHRNYEIRVPSGGSQKISLELGDLELEHTPDKKLLQARFRVKNTGPRSSPVAGRCVVVLKK